jgi:hypothetical protein
MAGLYTAPPAHGPIITDICGITPDASTLRWNMSAYPASESVPSCILAPPESFNPMLSQLCRMSACRFCCPNSDILCRVGDMSPTCFGHVGDTTRCRVGQGVQNDTTCRLFPTCRLNVGSFVSRNSAQTYSIP